MHVSTETSESYSPTSRADEPFQMINLSDLVLDVSLLSMIHPLTQNKAKPSVSKNVKTSGSNLRNPNKHTSVIKNQTEAERTYIDEELQKFATSVLKDVDSNVLPDVQTSLVKETIPDGDSSEKANECVPDQAPHERRSKKKADECVFEQASHERWSKKKVDECVPEQAAHERRSKKKDNYVVNVDDLTSDEEPLTNILAPGIAKRLLRRKGKVVMFKDSPSKEIKRKYGGMKSIPSKSSKGKSHDGPARSWSKVATPTRKRKVVSSSDFEFEVEEDVKDITHLKALMEEEEKEVEHGGDDNVGADIEDSVSGNDDVNDEDKKVVGEENATIDSNNQDDI
ncbi:hypothetical protein KIW84_012551 [Lathyrus oleraceus]|uniref:Uncharacterized protein n=1 Tax=Pisum sativum TaxID=3888 RepID=A0A9D5BHT3_PEA|nr:hypothetical protein KIW84_012551 [Pisum sativum]